MFNTCFTQLLYKLLFHEKLELIQYNAALAVTGAIQGSSSEKRYQELQKIQSIYDESIICLSGVKFQKKNTNCFIVGVLDQVFRTEVQKYRNQLLITAPNSVLFCQQSEHLLTS